MHRILPLAVILAVLTLLMPARAARAAGHSTGQTLYVPCYSHIYHGVKTRPIELTITLSVRNTDPRHAVTLTVVDYYDTQGKLVRHYLDKPVRLEPLMTVEYIVGETDTTGGSGANFLVTWTSSEPCEPLLAEAVMIGTSSQQGISFTSLGRPLGGN